MTGEGLTAKQALEYGIVDELSDVPFKRALEMSKKYAKKHLISMGQAKDAVQSFMFSDYDKEREYFIDCLQREETQATVKGFFSRGY